MALNDGSRLTSQTELTAAIDGLSAQCRIMRAIAKRTGTPELREYPANFSGLARIVTGQQLSAASARAIWLRVEAAFKPFEASALRAASDVQLASLGLSGGKIRTLKVVADAVHAGAVDFRKLNRLSDEAIHSALTSLHGIGPWTADIYLLFALRRQDAFAPGDLALQLAAQRLLKLQNRPSPAELLKIAERWRPWRGAAARLLWADYGLERAKPKKVSTRAKPQKN